MRAHEDVARVQGTLQETLFGLRYMDSTQRSLRKCVGRHKSQAVHPNLVDAVYGLENTHAHRGEINQRDQFKCFPFLFAVIKRKR